MQVFTIVANVGQICDKVNKAFKGIVKRPEPCKCNIFFLLQGYSDIRESPLL